jgi:Uma2 family endonuclease
MGDIVSAMIAQKERLSLHELARAYAQDGAFEWVDGRKVKLMPVLANHRVVLRALARWLDGLCLAAGLGEVFTEMPFVRVYDGDWVEHSRVPDLLFFAADRWQAYIAATPDWGDKPFVLVPDFIAEVVSLHDTYTDIEEKVDEYLAEGVRIIWVLDPRRQRVTVYTPDLTERLRMTDVLDGGDIFPGLRLPVRDLLASIA